jgi:hypothetical protein
MRIFLILFNLAIICFYSIFLITNFNASTVETSFMPVSVIVVLALNTIFILTPFMSTQSLIYLYIKRKSLEEKKKIDELSSK